MLHTYSQLSDTAVAYLSDFRKKSFLLYFIILLMATCALSSLPFIHTTISVKASGIIRPINERTEVKPVISGIIDTLYHNEGSTIKKGDKLLRIKDQITKSKKILNNYEINQHERFIHDLQLITSCAVDEKIVNQLISPLYREQVSTFLHQQADRDASLKKATKEFDMNSSLAKDKVISPKEFFDTQIEYDKAVAASKSFTRQQQSNWQQDLARYQLELSQYQEQLHQISTDASYYEVIAPISGTIQGINTRYAGSLLQTNETICTISPEGAILGECYVSPKNIGLIKKGQKVQFQIDAYDYNYFGILTGKVVAIDNDFSVIENTPAFKVRCNFDDTQLNLKNGFSGSLQKGLTFQARFVIGERTVWQLLWDKIDDWLNPASPQKG